MPLPYDWTPLDFTDGCMSAQCRSCGLELASGKRLGIDEEIFSRELGLAGLEAYPNSTWCIKKVKLHPGPTHRAAGQIHHSLRVYNGIHPQSHSTISPPQPLPPSPQLSFQTLKELTANPPKPHLTSSNLLQSFFHLTLVSDPTVWDLQPCSSAYGMNLLLVERSGEAACPRAVVLYAFN